MNYKTLVEMYEKLEATTKRLEKTYYISEFLKKVKAEELGDIVLLIQGKVYPDWDGRKMGVAARIVLKAIATAAGESADKVECEWKKTGDLGECAANLIKTKRQQTLFSKSLTCDKVLANLRKLTTLEGEGTVDRKVGLIAELMTSADGIEAKYIVRTVLEELRIGIAEGTLRDGIVWAYFGEKFGLSYDNKEGMAVVDDKNREKYNQYTAKVQNMIDLINDYGEIAHKIAENGERAFDDIGIVVGKPLKAMLAPKADSISDAFEKVGKPAIFEYKYDGFRMQIHRDGNMIRMYTRNLEEVTLQFPDVVEVVKEQVSSKNYILDCEVLGFDSKKRRFLPFQNISQRIRRKYDIVEMIKKIPVVIEVFDAMQINGHSLLSVPLLERKRMIKEILHTKKDKIECAKLIQTDDVLVAQKFYEEALEMGNEGIMAKSPDSEYKPGARVGFWVKVKPTMENLDLVIVGAEWGEGKRSKWLSSFILACKKGDDYLEVGRVGTGIKELETEDEETIEVTFGQLTKLLKPLIIEEKGMEVVVKPKIVVEIAYNEIQKSTTYNSGYALRFPRVIRLRPDRRADDASTLKMVEEFYEAQLKQKK